MKNYVKPLLSTVALCGLLAFSACDKDDPKPQPSTQELLMGKWYMMKTEDPAEPELPPMNECEQKSYWLFQDDGTLISEVFEKQLSDGSCYSEFTNSLEYILTADDKIMVPKFKAPEEYGSHTIESITADELVIVTYYGARIWFKKENN